MFNKMSPLPFAAIFAAFLCFTNAAPFAEDNQTPVVRADVVDYRLPLNVMPISYNITLKPYLRETDAKKFTFDGDCLIEIAAAQKTNEIQLHMKNLKVSLAGYYRKGTTGTKNLPAATPNNLTDIVTYKLSEELVANASYILHFIYEGSMDEDMHGFYRSNYTTPNHVTKWLGSTQFETHHARRAFPSFDEPKFKATFNLSLTRHRSFKTTGPTPLIEIKPQGDYITDVYASTPKMSTYILAFIVSELNDRSDGQFGVLARPEYYSQTEYSFDVGKPILAALDNYLGIPYYTMGNEKMHLAAIPDFSAGAMENWGLLTFRERALLYDEEHSTLSSKQYIAAVVAHEQAHMWFGDLVTCEFWSYTWLNEAFARYFQYFATDMVESHFEMPKQFVVDQIQTVMGMDSTKSTHPMSNENAKATSDFGGMFSSISYNKGATVVRMTEKIMGSKNFQNSLTEYLNKFKYQNTKPNDLFTIWKKYWPANFAKFADNYFSTYTTQVGYPVITFNRTTQYTVKISQKRFLLKDFDKADTKLTYTVPVTYTTNIENNFQNTQPKFFLEAEPFTVTTTNDTTWLIGNIQETGYYRVNYDINSWHEIHRALDSDNWSGIHELNRAQIVDDLLNFARAGEIDYSLAFDVIEYLKSETEYPPLSAAFNGLSVIGVRLGTDTQDFARYIQFITNKAYKKLGFEEKSTDTALEIYARSKVLSWNCKYSNNDCISKAKAYFDKNLKADPVPVNIRSVVYCTAMREGHENDFNKLYNKYKTETVATEETLILSSLGCVKDSGLVTRFFNMIISPEVRRQDKSSALSSLYSENNENVDRVFELVDQNIDELAIALGDYSSVASVVSGIAGRFTTETQLQKLKAFNSKHASKFGSSVSTLETAVTLVEYNLDWSNAKMGHVKAFFVEHGKNGAAINSISIVSLVFVALLAISFQ